MYQMCHITQETVTLHFLNGKLKFQEITLREIFILVQKRFQV